MAGKRGEVKETGERQEIWKDGKGRRVEIIDMRDKTRQDEGMYEGVKGDVEKRRKERCVI